MAKTKRTGKNKEVKTAPASNEIPTSLEELVALGAEESVQEIPETAVNQEEEKEEEAQENITDPIPEEAATEPEAKAEPETKTTSGQETIARGPVKLPPEGSDAALEATLKLVDTAPKNEVATKKSTNTFVLPDLSGENPLAELGPALKARREELGISFAEITRRTCIAQSTIIALESQPLDTLDAAFYIKNRLALYAKVLDIDPKSVQDFFESCINSTADKTEAAQRSNSMKRWLIIGGVIIALAVTAVILTTLK